MIASRPAGQLTTLGNHMTFLKDLSASDTADFSTEKAGPVTATGTCRKVEEATFSGQADLQVEELEPIIAPGLVLSNHNETFLTVEADLQAEELEPVIAPHAVWGP
jgi:hypothetical protein